MEWMALFLFLTICACLLLGFPVAFTLAGVSLLFAGIGIISQSFDPGFLFALPERVFGIVNNTSLIAVPLFVLMGVLLEKSRIAEQLLSNMAKLMGKTPGGIGLSVVFVGALLAASTGIVGATVVTMGLISLPAMLKNHYPPTLATGLVCATGTLGQIIPPSIALVLLGDVLSNAYHQAQIQSGVFNPESISVGDLFAGALLPGLLLVALYASYVLLRIFWLEKSGQMPKPEQQNSETNWQLITNLMAPIGLILLVLGSILLGIATPTEAAGLGALGALLLTTIKKQMRFTLLQEALEQTAQVTAMVFMILIGAALFSLVFRGFGGDELVQSAFAHLPGGKFAAMLVVMLLVFFLGFILDFIEITFVVVPIVGPILLAMGIDPVWLGIMLAVNLQTSFLTPPFGFALFYLRGVAPKTIATQTIYKGVLPFIGIQVLLLIILSLFPSLATWLPSVIFG